MKMPQRSQKQRLLEGWAQNDTPMREPDFKLEAYRHPPSRQLACAPPTPQLPAAQPRTGRPSPGTPTCAAPRKIKTPLTAEQEGRFIIFLSGYPAHIRDEVHRLMHAPAPGCKPLRFMRMVTPTQHLLVVTNTRKAGGFGKIRRAQTLQGGHPLVLKMVRIEDKRRALDQMHGKTPSTHYTSAALFQQEQQMMQDAQARAQPLGMLDFAGKIHMALQPMAGDMFDVLATSHGVAPGVLRHFIRSAAQDVQRAHAAGIVHRDIKPENFLYNAQGDMILADYGLAQRWAADGSIKGVVGTLQYLPLEVLRAATADASVDIWALGVTALELLTGRTSPFAGTEAQADQQALRRVHEAFHTWFAQLPWEGRRLNFAAMAKRGGPFDLFFARAASRHADLTSYILGNLLHPDPMLRPSAEAIVQAFARRDVAQRDAKQAQVLCHHLTHDVCRQAEQAALEAYRYAVQDAAPPPNP